MPIESLDHVNIRTDRLDAMVDWYTTVLGLRSGKRPDFGFPGAWLYAGDRAVVHMIGVGDEAGAGSETALKLEHFAFAARDRAAFEALLEERGERYRRSEVAEAGIVQVNIWDPDGNHIHVDFPKEE